METARNEARELEYSDLVLRCVREALERYRLNNRTNGRDRSWKQVAFDMFGPPLTMSDQEVDALLKPEAESLRRFAAGKQTPTPERLDRLTEFLIRESDLRENDLLADDPIPHEVHGLYSFFDFKLENFLRFPGTLIATCPAPHGGKEVRLLRSWIDGGYVKVSESIHWVSTAPRLNNLQNLDKYLEENSTGKFKREGWLIETPAQQILIFFKDRLKRTTTYTSVVYDGRDLEENFPRDTFWMLDHLDFSNPDGYQEHYPPENLQGANLSTLAIQRWTTAQLRRYGLRLTWES